MDTLMILQTNPPSRSEAKVKGDPMDNCKVIQLIGGNGD